MTTAIGVLGLGRMGVAIAARLLSQGFDVFIYNRTPGQAPELEAMGARPCATPRALASACGIVISSLTDEDAVTGCCEGNDGLLSDWRGGVHLSSSTLSPAAAMRLERLHLTAGVHYISAPVQGRPPMAEIGQLVAWVSGSLREKDVAAGVLSAIARRVVWLGDDPRQAAAAKLALNMLMNANIELFAEAFSYVDACKVDSAQFGEALTDTLFSAPLFKAIAAGVTAADDAAKGSDVRVSLKDLELLTSETHGLDLPVAVAVASVFERAVAFGWGDRDPAAVRRLFTQGKAS